jgi:citrate lyase subunit beta / citryl-CoA lyase
VSTTLTPRSRRSCLSVPASSPRKLEKAPGVGADELVLDLEDGVAAAAKDEARGALTELLGGGWSDGAVAVRVNAPGSPWSHLDLAALAALPALPDSVVVPKVESSADLAFVDRLLAGAEAASGRSRPIRVQALIETAAGLSRVGEIAACSDRLDSLIIGYADLAASLGRSKTAAAELDLWLAAQETLLTACRANGLQAIDGPYLGIAVDAGFEAAAGRARELGFDGKWAIHPAQVEHLNSLFSPTPAELEHARAVLAELERAGAEDVGAVALDGEMLDEALRVAAERVVARAEGAPTR